MQKPSNSLFCVSKEETQVTTRVETALLDTHRGGRSADVKAHHSPNHMSFLPSPERLDGPRQARYVSPAAVQKYGAELWT